jgi:hypothetical protein
MDSTEAASLVIQALDGLGVRYMLVGSLSTNIHGVPRATQDADLVVQLAGVPIRDVETRLAGRFRLDPQMSFETVTMTARYKFHAADAPFSVELFMLGDDEHDQERFRRRAQVAAVGFSQPVWCATAEDAIITKLRWSQNAARRKDIDDVRNILAVQGNALDWPYIRQWCDRHGTRAQLERILASIPPDFMGGPEGD